MAGRKSSAHAVPYAQKRWLPVYLLLGPDTTYPAHSHTAEEYYLPLSGTARWYDEDSGWRRVPPLSLLFHRSSISHSMQTMTEPLLAIYLWFGREVGGKASIHKYQAS